MCIETQGTNPGLELANAFGVMFAAKIVLKHRMTDLLIPFTKAPYLLLALCLFGAELHCRAAQSIAPNGLETKNGTLIARRLPHIVYRGGPFLRRPLIITVTFKGDDPKLVARLEKFGRRITQTRWWREVTEGYCAREGDCIGSGRPGFHVRLDVVLPGAVRDVDVELLLTSNGEAGRLGPLDSDSLILAYLPPGVGLSDAFVPRYCDGGPRAFHRALKIGNMKVAFAVLPRCGNESELTSSASHEIVESATNPDPSARGFAFEQGSGNLGFTASGVEPVDPCGLLDIDDDQTLESGFVVQRAWSNRAASLGRDPCVPSDTKWPYVALVPRQPTIRLTHEGERATITLDAASERSVRAWSASAFDLTGSQEGVRCADVSLDKSEVVAGQTLNLTITLRKRSAKRLCVVGLVSTLGTRSYLWPVAVLTR